MDVESMISKIKIIKGDCGILGLGISEEDRKDIVENVSLIYHCAATIRFDEKLKRAVELNTRGTQEMINLGLECKKLEVGSVIVFNQNFNLSCSVLDVRLHVNCLLSSSRKFFAWETLRPSCWSPKDYQVSWTFARRRGWTDVQEDFRNIAEQLRIHKSTCWSSGQWCLPQEKAASDDSSSIDCYSNIWRPHPRMDRQLEWYKNLSPKVQK